MNEIIRKYCQLEKAASILNDPELNERLGEHSIVLLKTMIYNNPRMCNQIINEIRDNIVRTSLDNKWFSAEEEMESFYRLIYFSRK